MNSYAKAFPLLEEFADQQLQAVGTPGLAMAVTDRHELLHAITSGWADVAARAPVTEDTLFEIGSISKSFTAIVLLQLQQAGRIDLYAPVVRYLPWFHVPSRYEPITLHHLLSHTAGIIRGTDLTTDGRYEAWTLRATETGAPPGTYFHYSNAAYKALGLVLEELLGRSYGDIIQERILGPLEMAATDPVITHDTRRRLAVGYEPYYDDRPAHRSHPLVPATWLETGTADGSIAAPIGDMATYLRMLLNRGRGPQGPILSEEGFQLMIQRLIQPPQGDEDFGSFYGYGLNIRDEEGSAVIGHGGEMVGHHAAILADLDAGLGVTVLINGPGNPKEVARYALRVMRAASHGRELPSLPPFPDPARVQNAADYAGTYAADARSFTLAAEGEGLVMDWDGERLPLERYGEDRFYVPHRDLDRFLLRFGREAGLVVEASHGADWYTNGRYAGRRTFDHPPEWVAYPGHYRSHNPWHTNFRAVLRKGELVLIEPSGDEQALVPLGEGTFRIGDDERVPERLRFDTVLQGQALRAHLSACDYYRTFTP